MKMIAHMCVCSAAFALQTQAQTLTLYSHGNPTADEQYMLELINRARVNPTAEGIRLAGVTDIYAQAAINYFGVDLARLRREFASYPTRPPVAMNAQLLAAARRHSTDMARKNFQSHTGSDGSSIFQRINQAGFEANIMNESIYSNLVTTTYYAHVGFNIDWGSGSGGTQQGLGHRMNIMNFGDTVFREAGIGVAERTGASAQQYGKLSITQNFANASVTRFFLLGVAYNDVNRNGICDPGEGLSGIKVTPSVGSYYAVTSTSGGYAIPFTLSPGDETVTFSGGGLTGPQVRSFSLIRQNTKCDLRLLPTVPVVSVATRDAIASERGKMADGDAVFRVSRTGSTAADLKVTFTRPLKGGKGKAIPNDYKIAAVRPGKVVSVSANKTEFTVVIPTGKASADVKISAVKDKRKEPVEKVIFKLGVESNYTKGTPSSSTISIKR